MGVRGLTTFIDSHNELLTDYQLHDTKIVVDGNNLYHFLYYYYDVSCEYGGDYDHFNDSCTAFFSTLLACNIEPYVVFDGAYAADGCKFKTSVGRAQDRIRLSELVSAGRSAKLMPILTHEVFCNALKRMNIPHVMCDFEADRQVAALANHWDCPVLTNDSDFFVFNISSGVILLDYMNVNICKWKSEIGTVYRYLKVQTFFCTDLMRLLKIKEHSMLVLFATLLGNDIVDAQEFNTFFERGKLPKGASRQVKARRQVKIASLIKWLQSVQSISDAEAHVLAHIPHNRQTEVKFLIQKSIACYTDLISDLHPYFDSSQAVINSRLATKGGNLLPEWFQRQVQSCYIPVGVVNVIANRRIMLLSQVEQMNETSSYSCSLFLRQIAYAITLSVDVPTSNPDCIVITEYDRHHKSQKQNAVKPVWKLNGVSVPSLYQLQELAHTVKMQFLLNVLAVTSDSTTRFSFEIQFLIALIRYWIVNAAPKVTKLHVLSLVLCCLKLGSLDNFITCTDGQFTDDDQRIAITTVGNVKKSSSCNSTDLTTVVERAKIGVLYQELQNCKLAMEKFSTQPRHNNAHAFDANIIHAFSQFQSCLQAVGFIAKLLSVDSHAVVTPSSTFNGTFLYNLLRDLRTRREPDAYIADILGRNTTIFNCYHSIVEALLAGLPNDCLCDIPPAAKKRSRRKKSSKTANNCNSPSCSEQERSDPECDTHEKTACDVNNKFSALGLCDF